MLRKISAFIVNKRYWILSLMIVLAVISAFLIPRVGKNEDMTRYLPDDSSMKAGADIMEKEFPEMETLNTIRVMFDDLTAVQKAEVREELEAIPYVDSVVHEEGSGDYNKGNHTLYIIGTACEYGSDGELSIEKALDTDFGEYSMVWHNDDTGTTQIPMWILAAAVAILMLILLVMCGSWLEPFLFMGVIGVAIVINMGTNIIMGSISDVTFSIAAILQLVLSMDYSIILINRYRQERQLSDDKQAAMKNALVNAFSPVASSALTTVAGLLTLVFMSFKIGTDLGIVLAKGVFISMVCVLTMLPGVIIACDRLILKTAKRVPRIPMGWAAAFSHKMRRAVGIFFLIFLAGVCFMQTRTDIAYTLEEKDPVASVFPADNTLVMVYENRDEDKAAELAAELEKDRNIKGVSSYSTTLGKQYTADELADALSDAGSGVNLDADALGMLYYDYFGGEIQPMTACEFLNFLSGTVMENETFAGRISGDTRDRMDMLKRFSEASELTRPMSAGELASFFGIEKSDVRDLLLYYMIKNDRASAASMTLPEFAGFVLDEVAKDKTYGAMFDRKTLSRMRRLAAFTDAEKMTKPSGYREIASLTGMDADTVKLLFIYERALSGGYTPGRMTLPEFATFLRTDVMKDPLLSSYIDSGTGDMIDRLAALTDRKTLNAKLTAAEMAEALGVDREKAETLFALANARDAGGRTMSLPEFTKFINGDLPRNPLLAGYFDRDVKARLRTLGNLVQAASSSEGLTPRRTAELLSMDEDAVTQLYFLYLSANDAGFRQEMSAAAMPLADFIALAGKYAPEDQLADLERMERIISAAVSGRGLPAAELAAVTGMDEASVKALFAARSAQSGKEITSMPLREFVSLASGMQPQNGQLRQLKSIIDLAVSGRAADAAVLSSVSGMNEEQARQLLGLNLAAGKAVSLSAFTAFLADTVIADETYAGGFTEEQKAQIARMNRLIQLAASGEDLTVSALAEIFAMDEETVSLIFRLYYGSQVTGAAMSLPEMTDFVLGDPAVKGFLDKETVSQLSMMRRLITAAQSGRSFTYAELAKTLGTDSAAVKMLFTFHDSGTKTASWRMSVKEMIDFLVKNKEKFAEVTGRARMEQLQTVRRIIYGSVKGKRYTAGELADVVGMPKEQARQLCLLYASRHGDTSDWRLSVKGFIDFMLSDVLSDANLAGRFGGDTAGLLASSQKLVNAVISGRAYTAAEMGGLLAGMSDDLRQNTVDLLYLYASSENSDLAERTMSMDTLFHYLTAEVLDDPRFAEFIDEDMRAGLSDAGAEMDDGRAQLVSDRYSRMIITSSYPEESEETTAFLDKLNARCGSLFDGDYHLVGNSALVYEMQKIFDRELRFITLLTALAIFVIVALTFRSLFIPLLLVLVVQAGVYATVSVIGLTGGSMYYLALLIVECILMGATIDYGILFTNYYRENRLSLPVKEAMGAAYEGSVPTILTSGLILIIVTAIIGNFFEEPTISAIVGTISIGALCAVLLILFVLPGLLALCDRFVCCKKKRE